MADNEESRTKKEASMFDRMFPFVLACVSVLALTHAPSLQAQPMCGPPPKTFPGSWCSVDGPHIRVWWSQGPERSRRAFQAQATRVRDYVENRLWPLYVNLLRRGPVSDRDMTAPSGGDRRYDIMLVDRTQLTAKYGESPLVGPWPERARYSMVNRELPDGRLRAKVAHELMHGFLTAFRCSNCRWLEEATATWAEHLTAPAANTEHEYTQSLFTNPKRPLDYDPSVGDEHKNGAYLFLLFLERWQGRGPTIVRDIWQAAERSTGPLAAIDAALSGGIKPAWRQFITLNWNADPVPEYRAWDKLTDGISTRRSLEGEYSIQLNQAASRTYPLAVDLPPLSAAYFVFDFATDVRTVHIQHNIANLNSPAADMIVLTKFRDQNWKVEPNWSGTNVNEFCRDVPNGRLDRLVVILGNSGISGNVDFRTISGPPSVVASTAGCLGPDAGYAECTLTFDYGPSYGHRETQAWVITGRTPGTTSTYDYQWTASGGGSAFAMRSASTKLEAKWSIQNLQGSSNVQGTSKELSTVAVPQVQSAIKAPSEPPSITIRDGIKGEERLTPPGTPSPITQTLDEFWKERRAPLSEPRIEGSSTETLPGAWARGAGQPMGVGVVLEGEVTCRWSWPRATP
jgi:hypothetical protein